MSQVNILPIYRIWQLTFIASYLGNLTFPKVQTIISEYPQSDEQFAAIFKKFGATLFFQPCTIWIFTFDL